MAVSTSKAGPPPSLGRISGLEVLIYDQWMAMEQSIRVDGPGL